MWAERETSLRCYLLSWAHHLISETQINTWIYIKFLSASSQGRVNEVWLHLKDVDITIIERERPLTRDNWLQCYCWILTRTLFYLTKVLTKRANSFLFFISLKKGCCKTWTRHYSLLFTSIINKAHDSFTQEVCIWKYWCNMHLQDIKHLQMSDAYMFKHITV